ncbi:MAG: nucleotidyltransferase domain-containing protein [bacterium]
MRLSGIQQQSILQTLYQNFGAATKVWLFGSRVDDSRRGGDVDLYVETSNVSTLLTMLRCKMALEERLDLSVDLIVKDQTKDDPIYKIAKKEGVQL